MTIEHINVFLRCSTPKQWLERAKEQEHLLLLDHAHCEKKAAATAMGLLYRYPDRIELLQKMSRLAREELRHFEQILKILASKSMPFQHLTPGRYAHELHKHIKTHEPEKLVDTLIVGAFIEARSCERFMALTDHLESNLANFYQKLHRAEARHYKEYLELAINFSTKPIDSRIRYFANIEAELISTEDTEFRFHSGVPK